MTFPVKYGCDRSLMERLHGILRSTEAASRRSPRLVEVYSVRDQSLQMYRGIRSFHIYVASKLVIQLTACSAPLITRS